MHTENQLISPSLIHKKQSECFSDEFLKRRNSNRRRAFKISNKARQAKVLKNELSEYIRSQRGKNLPNDQYFHLNKLKEALDKCANHSLYRKYENNGAIEYIASQTCKHKLCTVCNSERQRTIRQKYFHFFKNGAFSIPEYKKVVKKDDRGREKKNAKGELMKKREVVRYRKYKTSDFNFMHLTLTVPHNENGFRNERFYAQELMKEFNYMRKKSFWKRMVFGGEFGCEITKGENGLHIHIHALLIVHDTFQSRNELYRNILKAWNQQTVSDFSARKKFTENDKKGLCISLGAKNGKVKSLSDKSLKVFKSLNPKGSTLISLENLYVLSKKKKGPYDQWQKDKQKWKHYVDAKDPDQFMSGIMETIKYHFEPIALKKHVVRKTKKERIEERLAKEGAERVFDYELKAFVESKEHAGLYDFDLLTEILPKIYGRPMYRKFGCLHGIDALNINSEVEDEINQILKDSARDETINPESGKSDKKCSYLVCRASAVFYDEKNQLRPKIPELAKVEKLKASEMRKALLEMIKLQIREQMKVKDNKIKMKTKSPDLNQFEAMKGIEPNYEFDQ